MVQLASGDPETLAEEKEGLAHLHFGFLGGSMVDIEAGQPEDKESIREPEERGKALR